MKSLVFIIVAVMSGLIVNTLGILAPIDGYKVVDITWTIQPNISGVAPFNLTGTVQDVWAHVKTTWPDYPVPDLDLASIETPSIDRREWTNLTDGYVKCGFWPVTTDYYISRGADYLYKVPGKPELSPGPSECGRVSCSFQSAIWWCNDNDDSMELDSFGDIADAARDINNWCAYREPLSTAWWVSGQNFLPGSWNVIVRKDTDNC